VDGGHGHTQKSGSRRKLKERLGSFSFFGGKNSQRGGRGGGVSGMEASPEGRKRPDRRASGGGLYRRPLDSKSPNRV